jgi:hypothetical protein
MQDRLSSLGLKRQSLFDSHRPSRWLESDLDQKQKTWEWLEQFLNPKSAEESVTRSA